MQQRRQVAERGHVASSRRRIVGVAASVHEQLLVCPFLLRLVAGDDKRRIGRLSEGENLRPVESSLRVRQVVRAERPDTDRDKQHPFASEAQQTTVVAQWRVSRDDDEEQQQIERDQEGQTVQGAEIRQQQESSDQ